MGKNQPLFLPEKNLSAPFTLKAEPHENFVKGMDKTGRGFEYMKNKFLNVSDAKIKDSIFIGPQIRELMQDSIFIGPQIRELMQDKQFDADLNETERNAWLSFNP